MKELRELYPETIIGDNLNCAKELMEYLGLTHDELVIFLENFYTLDNDFTVTVEQVEKIEEILFFYDFELKEIREAKNFIK